MPKRSTRSAKTRWLPLTDHRNYSEHLVHVLNEDMEEELLQQFRRLFVRLRGIADIYDVCRLFTESIGRSKKIFDHLAESGYEVHNTKKWLAKCQELSKLIAAEALNRALEAASH